jgi:outer membrane receptor for ferrienterochelin and colicins
LIDAVSQSKDTVNYRTDEINIYGTKIKTNIYDSPEKIQYIDKQKIMNKNGESLSDILQLGAGVYIKSYGGNNSLNTISFNGLGAEHTLILLNGFKMNSSQNNLIDLNTITKDNIESIEILNSGSSSIYGSEAMGGVVNIITKNNPVKDLSLKLNGQAGSYEQRKFFFGIGKNFKNLSIDLNLSKESSLNNFDYYYNSGYGKSLKERANSNYDHTNYTAELKYLISKSAYLNYFSNYSDQQRSIPGIETGSAPSNSVQNDKNLNNILSYVSANSDNISINTQLNYQINLQNYSDQAITKSYYKNIFISGSSQMSYTKKDFEIVSGMQLNYSALKSNEVQDNIKRYQPGIFVVSKIDLSSYLEIYPSVRYDYISDISDNVLSGKLGINIKPVSDAQFNVKASAGNNYAAPTFNELYWKDLGNTDLKPERSFNFETGVVYGFSFISDNSVEFTFTHIDASNKIVWSPNNAGLWKPSNIGLSSSNVFLLDANFKKQLTDVMSAELNINYSYTSSVKKSKEYDEDPTYDKQIFYLPQELAKFNLALKYRQTGINVFYTFTGRRFTNFENTQSLNAVDLIEGNIYQNIQTGIVNTQVRFEVNNLFNSDYQIIEGYPMPLRNYKLSVSLEY